MQPTTSPNPIVLFLKRNEVVMFLVAIIVTALSGLDLPAPVQSAITGFVPVLWFMLVGFVFEGFFRPEYFASIIGLLRSKKVQLALVALLVLVVEAFFEPLGLELPPGAIETILTWLVGMIVGKGGVDGIAAAISHARDNT